MDATKRFEAAAQAAADDLRQGILKERPRGCPGTFAARRHNEPNSKSRHGRESGEAQPVVPLAVRAAHATDTEFIQGWINITDLRFLGGDPQRPTLDQVRNWIDQAIGAYVLMAGDASVAFFTIAHTLDRPVFQFLDLREDDVSLEFGRLVVDPALRRKGYGTSLFMHVYRVFLSCLSRSALADEAPTGPFHILARQAHDNTGCAAFFSRLPLRTIHAPSSPNYHWYLFSDYALLYKHPGINISTRRRAVPRLSQQRLAFFACMDPSTLAMVEAGHRVLRTDDARRLRDILCHSPQDELRYASDILACTFNSDLWTYPSHLGSELTDVAQTLWIFSDVLAENTAPSAIMLSSAALLNDRDRFFFVPPTYPLDDVQMICRLFVAHFSAHQYDTNVLYERVRFYRAPGGLCSLRIVIHDPDPEPGSFGARKLSIAAGDTAMRFDVAHKGDLLVTRFLEYIKKRLLYTDLAPGTSSDGFERISVDDFLVPHSHYTTRGR